jgi:hypothetical protein
MFFFFFFKIIKDIEYKLSAKLEENSKLEKLNYNKWDKYID